MILLLRVFAPAASPAAARENGRRLREALGGLAPAAPEPPEPYWKVPEWYEHTFRLTPANQAGFDTVLALGGEGWSHVVRDGECSAVWNSRAGSRLLLPEVTWAELRLNR